MLTEADREFLFDRIAAWCDAWAVGGASQEECDELGMAEAQRLATRRALAGLGVTPDAAVVDGKWNFVGAGVRPRRDAGEGRSALPVGGGGRRSWPR